MKKILSLILCLILCLSLFACNEKEQETSSSTTAQSTSVSTSEPLDNEDNNDIPIPFISPLDINSLEINGYTDKDKVGDSDYYKEISLYGPVWGGENKTLQKVPTYFNNLDLEYIDAEDLIPSSTDIEFTFTYSTFLSPIKIVVKGLLIGRITKGLTNSGGTSTKTSWYKIKEGYDMTPYKLFQFIEQELQSYEPPKRISSSLDGTFMKIPNKTVQYVQIRKSGFAGSKGSSSIQHRDQEKIALIKDFLEQIPLDTTVNSSELLLTGADSCSIEFYFEDNTYTSVYLCPIKSGVYDCLSVGNAYYDIHLQSSELIELLSFQW